MFSRAPITAAENLLLSKSDDYSCWKTRRTLGICAGRCLVLQQCIWAGGRTKWNLLPPSGKRCPGRQAQKRPPFCWGTSTARPTCGARATTLCSAAAGRTPTVWHSSGTRATPSCRPLMAGGMPRMRRKKAHRQIWCSKTVPVKSSRVVFNGLREPQVSDHAGVLIEL